MEEALIAPAATKAVAKHMLPLLFGPQTQSGNRESDFVEKVLNPVGNADVLSPEGLFNNLLEDRFNKVFQRSKEQSPFESDEQYQKRMEADARKSNGVAAFQLQQDVSKLLLNGVASTFDFGEQLETFGRLLKVRQTFYKIQGTEFSKS